MKKAEKLEILESLWYKRNPSHDNDMEGNSRFWETAMMVFEEYAEATKLPVSDKVFTETLENINAVMWESYMIKGKSFDRKEGEKIMHLLEHWASN